MLNMHIIYFCRHIKIVVAMVMEIVKMVHLLETYVKGATPVLVFFLRIFGYRIKKITSVSLSI